MEEMSKEALAGLTGELQGTYCGLDGMTKEMQTQLTEDHFLFNDSDRQVFFKARLFSGVAKNDAFCSQSLRLILV